MFRGSPRNKDCHSDFHSDFYGNKYYICKTTEERNHENTYVVRSSRAMLITRVLFTVGCHYGARLDYPIYPQKVQFDNESVLIDWNLV